MLGREERITSFEDLNKAIGGGSGLEVNSMEKARKMMDLLQPLGEGGMEWSKDWEGSEYSIHRLKLEGLEYPFIRADAFYKGASVLPILSVCRNQEARRVWDERFDGMKTIEYLSQGDILATSLQKGQWPVSPRDLCHVIGTYQHPSPGEDEDIVDYLAISTEDARVPLRQGYVRGEILIASWRLHQTKEGVKVSYIAYVDPKGTLPASLFKLVQSQITLCVPNVQSYLTSKGPLPSFVNVGKFKCSNSLEILEHTFTKDAFQVRVGKIESDQAGLTLALPKGMEKSLEVKLTSSHKSWNIEIVGLETLKGEEGGEREARLIGDMALVRITFMGGEGEHTSCLVEGKRGTGKGIAITLI